MGSALMFTSVSHHHLPKKRKKKKKISPQIPEQKKGQKKNQGKGQTQAELPFWTEGNLKEKAKKGKFSQRTGKPSEKTKKPTKSKKKTQKAKKKKKDEMQRHCSKTRGGWPAARREEACGPQALRSNGLFLLLVEEKGEWTFFTRRTT